MQGGSYEARLDRQLLANIYTEGVLGSTSFAVTQRAAGANFTVDVAAGVAVVQGDDQANQGKYMCISTAVESVTIPAAPGSNSRYDLIIIDVNDPTAGGGAGDNFTVRVVQGSAAATPAVPALPDSALLLATIGPIATATASITNSLIADGRAVARLAHPVVDSAAIADLGIATGDIANSAVTTAKLADNNVTLAKLSSAVYAVAATADTLVLRNSNGRIAIASPFSDDQAATKGYADDLVDSAWTALSLNLAGGWTFPVAGSPSALRYKKIGNVGFLCGAVVRSSGSDSLIGTLPAGFRPGSYHVSTAFSGSALQVTVSGVTGEVLVSGASNGSNVFINMIYSADQ